MSAAPPVREVAIVGAGFGGLGTAIRLKQSGLTDFVVLERAGALGGVWRDNAYPGAACDVQSHLYSFSFALNPDWTRSYSGQAEIWAYLERCAREFDLLPAIRFNHPVEAAVWDPAGHWRLQTPHGELRARVLVMATGALSEPAVPDLPGLEQFAGPAFHSARWPADLDLSGRSVAVVGTGASAVQFVPAIQPQVSRLTVFQRTPAWVLPRQDQPISPAARQRYRRWPALLRLRRAGLAFSRELTVLAFQHPALMSLLEATARRHLAAAVADPVLRAKLTPRYTIGCKRVLLSDDFYPALTQPNVDVVAAGVSAVRAHGVAAADGREYPADVLIFGTGFQVTDLPFSHRVFGRAGRSLAEAWAGSPQAYLGTTVSGFPNLFILQGPNTGLGHTSVLLMIEAQIEHLLGALRYQRGAGAVPLEPRPERQAAFAAEMDARLRGTVWLAGGCRSWYLDRTGRNSTLWPGTTWEFARRLRRFQPGDYALTAG